VSNHEQLARLVRQAAADAIEPATVVLQDDGTILSGDRRFAAIVGFPADELKGCRLQHLLAPDALSTFASLLAQPHSSAADLTLLARGRGAVGVKLWLRALNKVGQLTATVVEQSALAEVRAVLAGAAEDLPANLAPSDHGTSEAPADAREVAVELPEHLTRKIAQQAALAAFAERSLEITEMAELGAAAVQTLARTLNADVALTYELQADGEYLRSGAAVGIDDDYPMQGVSYPTTHFPMVHRAVVSHEPVVVEDLAASEFGRTIWTERFGVTSGICAPIPGKKRTYGAIGAFSKGRLRFTAADVDFIRTIANIYAHALERKEAEDYLERRQEYYRAMIEDLSDAISLIEPDGTLVFASASLERILGHKPAVRIRRNIFLSHHPDEIAHTRRVFAEVIANPGQVRCLECRLRHADGTWRDVEVMWRAVTRPEGGLVVISTMRDVSARKRAEREHSLLASIVESSDDSIVSRDLEGRITSWNAGAERLYGFKAAEVLGRRREDFEPPALAAQMREVFKRVIEDGQPQRLEAKRIRKDGATIDVSTTISPLFGANGGIVGMTAISHDITDRRLAERARELARSNAELEQFAYVASHDLKEPLRVIEVYAQLVKQRLAEFMDGTTAQFLGYIEDGARRGRELIDALLDYARLAPKSAVLTAVDCTAVLREVRQNLSAAIESSGAVLTHEPEHLPVLMGDRTLFVQIFQNLIGNALKFRSQQPPAVHIAAERRGAEWLFAVRDNGIGIDPRYSQRIFDMFQRLYPRKEYPGTGMGLTICKMAVEKLGGRIWMESEPGKGATFFFTVPSDS
jgi:PAS domain S-box-containing protein